MRFAWEGHEHRRLHVEVLQQSLLLVLRLAPASEKPKAIPKLILLVKHRPAFGQQWNSSKHIAGQDRLQQVLLNQRQVCRRQNSPCSVERIQNSATLSSRLDSGHEYS